MEPMERVSQEQIYLQSVYLKLPDGKSQILEIKLKLADRSKERIQAICEQVVEHAKHSGMYGMGSKLSNFVRASELKDVQTFAGEEYRYQLGPAKKIKKASKEILIGTQRKATEAEPKSAAPAAASLTPEQKSHLITGAKQFLDYCERNLENEENLSTTKADFERITKQEWFKEASIHDKDINNLFHKIEKKFKSFKEQA